MFTNNTNYIIYAENFYTNKLFKKNIIDNVEKIYNYNNDINDYRGYTDKSYNYLNYYIYNNNYQYLYPLSEFKDYNYFVFCNSQIYSHPLFNEYYNKLIMSEYLINNINEKRKIIKNTNILGVFLRFQRFYGNTEKDFIHNYINEIKQIEHKYDKILLISCVKEYNNIFKETFKDKIIYFTDKELVEDINNDWMTTCNDIEYESVNVFTEVYIAAKYCNYLIGGSSNMFIGALIINPTIKFKWIIII